MYVTTARAYQRVCAQPTMFQILADRRAAQQELDSVLELMRAENLEPSVLAPTSAAGSALGPGHSWQVELPALFAPTQQAPTPACPANAPAVKEECKQQ